MPVFVKAHMQRGSNVKAYVRGASKPQKAFNLTYALSVKTARGMSLSKPQKKAFLKARTYLGKYYKILK